MKQTTKQIKKIKKVKEKIYFIGDDSFGEDTFTRYTESELKEELKNGALTEGDTVYELTSYKIMEVYDQPQGIRIKKDN